MQGVPLGEPLDRRDLRAVPHDGQGQAGIDPPAVDQDRAGPALAVVAALLGPGQAEVLAEGVEQGRPGGDVQLPADAVDREGDRGFRG